MDKEILKKAKATNSPAELKDIVKKLGISLNDDEAKHYFDVMHSDAKLSAQELAMVSGGGCGKERKKINRRYEEKCGSWKLNENAGYAVADRSYLECCAFCKYKDGDYCNK